MKVGVLGGTRFIGFQIVEALLRTGVEVSIFHRGRSRELRAFSGPVERVLGDRDDVPSLEPFFQRTYDAVIDLSGYTPKHLEPILSRWRSQIGQYLFCSTSSVYRIPPPVLFDESAHLTRRSGTYGGDKALVEEALLTQAARHGWPVTIMRPQGVLGSFDAEQPLYIARRILAKQPLLIRPDTVDKRINFLWVDDLARCFLRAMRNPAAFSQVFNVAGSDVATPNSLGSFIQQVLGEKDFMEVVLEPRLSRHLPDLGLPWLPYDLIADNGKIKKSLGVEFTPLKEVLQRIIGQWSRMEESRLRLKRQRWERRAVQGKVPPPWIKLFWRIYDGFRAGFARWRQAWYNVQILNI